MMHDLLDDIGVVILVFAAAQLVQEAIDRLDRKVISLDGRFALLDFLVAYGGEIACRLLYSLVVRGRLILLFVGSHICTGPWLLPVNEPLRCI